MSRVLSVKQIINFPVNSNCFVVNYASSGECFLVDPACGTGETLVEYLTGQGLTPSCIMLTHEHFDHISSVEYLRNYYTCKVIASDVCSNAIGNAKKNLSLFNDQVGFTCKPADILIEKRKVDLNWNEFMIQFHLTPGHSAGGMCFSIENNLFTGDTLMNAYKPVIKLPGGDKVKLNESINRLRNLYNESTAVFPGHGEPFLLEDIKI